ANPAPANPKSTSSGKRRNRKTCFVCKSVDHLIKDCDYHAKKMAQPTQRNYAHRVLTQSKPVLNTAVRPVSAAVPRIMVTQPRLAHPIVTKSKSPIRRHIPLLTQSKPVSITAVRPVCADVPKIMVTQPRHAYSINSKSKSPIRRHITRSPSAKTSNSPPRVTAAQALVVSAAKGKKGK
nr:hypothetical protein [Tanacetum cinerariifolium]